MPKTASIANHINMIGPNNLPIDAVPNCCTKNKTASMLSTIITIMSSFIFLNARRRSICRKPSMADVTEMGGVIIPSASNAAPPIIAGKTSHFFCRRTNAYKEKIPPSPLLSARNVRMTYLTVVCKVSVQKISEIPPNTTSSLIGFFSPTTAFITYKGEVPISP